MVTRLPGDVSERMAPSSVNDERDRDASANTETGAATRTADLLEQLQADRVWLLQQIDGGRWPDLRLEQAQRKQEEC